jgi:ATP-binding protein involved in chromosome partitioning
LQKQYNNKCTSIFGDIITEEAQIGDAKVTVAHPSILKVIEQRKKLKEKLSNIKNKIGVYSAKGGVGKTTTTVNLAFTLKNLGYKVGILDADIDCPNVCMFLGINYEAPGTFPIKPFEKDGVLVLSTAMFVDDNKKPIIWRGPMIGKMVAEFLENTEWGSLDYLLVDLPPGTSDAPLSIIQLLDLKGFIIVTTPQHISAINAIRSGMMAKRLGVSILGIVENMSNGNPKGGLEVAEALNSTLLGCIKQNTLFGELSDKGEVPSLKDKNINEDYINIIKKILG